MKNIIFKKRRVVGVRASRASIAIAAVIASASIFGGTAIADRFDDQIRKLRNQNNSSQAVVERLEARAESYEDAINKLEQQINGLQQSIVANQNASAKLERDIVAKEKEINQQKKVLGQNIKAMYLEGEISTLEILAASRDISDFVNREVARSAVQSNITETLNQIKKLKKQLEQKQQELKSRIAEQKEQQAELSEARAEQAGMLAYTEDQKAAYNKRISVNKSKIAELERQQALENIRRFGGTGGRLGGGGYPWGYAKCIHTGQVEGWCPNYDWGVNGSIYNWSTGGYGFRNCTDWVSFRVRSTGGYVPSGLGNAKLWDDRAPSKGYSVGSTPKQGAAAVSNYGYYGHVMYVEAVNGDGTITVSDYNRAGTGKYDLNVINPSGLSFVYF